MPGSGGDEDPRENLEVGGDLDPDDVIAEIVTTVTDQADFMIHATVPVPKGTFMPGQSDVPLTIGNHDMTAVPTQVEMVTQYPDASDGADVVEVIGRVRRPESAQPGDEVVYFVGFRGQEPGEIDIHNDVDDLFMTPGGIKLFTSDVFDHTYTADLYASVRNETGAARVLKDGSMVRQWATHEILRPTDPVDGNQGTLPHMMGIHAYITAYRHEKFVTLDLHVHNGMHGLDAEDPDDDALMNVYFKNLKLRLPSGWKVLYAFDSPYAGSTNQSGGWAWTSLVQSLQNNKMHVMGRQSRFVRRLALVRTNDEEAVTRARNTVESAGLAFNRAGTNANGDDLFSWWNGETARYYGQKHRLPSLDHVGRQHVRDTLASDLAGYETQLAEGVGASYPFTASVMGWAHPWGSSYGGMTGGDEIHIFDSVETAYGASIDGYRLSQLYMRAYMDRHATALYAADGRTTRLEDVLFEGPDGPYMPMFFKLRPNLANPEPFGFNEAPSFQTNAVQSQGRKPSYEDELLSFAPVDQMHYIRFTRNLKTLAWLGNDSLAKDQLEAAAEMFRMSFHEYPNSEYGVTQVSGLLRQLNNVAALPGNGVSFARGQAWGTDTALAAYSMGTPEFRDRIKPWLDLVTDMVLEGQSDCHGHIMSQYGYDYGFRMRQSFESAFVENAIRGLGETVYRDVDPERYNAIKASVLESAYAEIAPPFWDEGHDRPWFWVQTGPGDPLEPEICSGAREKADWYDYGTYYSSFAYAYELSGDQVFLQKAAQLAGGGDLMARLEDFGLDNLKNTAALLALCQEMAGE